MKSLLFHCLLRKILTPTTCSHKMRCLLFNIFIYYFVIIIFVGKSCFRWPLVDLILFGPIIGNHSEIDFSDVLNIGWLIPAPAFSFALCMFYFFFYSRVLYLYFRIWLWDGGSIPRQAIYFSPFITCLTSVYEDC